MSKQNTYIHIITKQKNERMINTIQMHLKGTMLNENKAKLILKDHILYYSINKTFFE